MGNYPLRRQFFSIRPAASLRKWPERCIDAKQEGCENYVIRSCRGAPRPCMLNGGVKERRRNGCRTRVRA
jgi:hypothetical protein